MPISRCAMPTGRSKGFSLLEMILVLLIVGILGGISFSFFGDLAGLYSRESGRQELFEEARQAMRLLASEIRPACAIAEPPRPAPGQAANSASLIRLNRPYDNPTPHLSNLTFQYNSVEHTITRVSDQHGQSVLARHVSDFTVSRDAFNLIGIVLTLDNGAGNRITLRATLRPRGFPPAT